MVKVENCPVCGYRFPRLTLYTPMAVAEDPTLWTCNPEYTPKVVFYRVECSNCRATTPNVYFDRKEAIKAWNDTVDVTGKRRVLMKYKEIEL